MKSLRLGRSGERKPKAEWRSSRMSSSMRQTRAKGFAHRQRAAQWAVLAHNLRVLVRMRRREETAREAEKPIAA